MSATDDKVIEWAKEVVYHMEAVGAESFSAEKSGGKYGWRVEKAFRSDYAVRIEVYDPNAQYDSTIKKYTVPISLLERDS